MNKYLSLLLTSAIMITGCSSGYRIESNLDKDNIANYFNVWGIKALTNQELSRYPYKVLGTVEGISCQENDNHPLPNISDARSEALTVAADMGANAIVFSTCIEFEPSSACLASLSCYGKAIQLLQDQPFE